MRSLESALGPKGVGVGIAAQASLAASITAGQPRRRAAASSSPISPRSSRAQWSASQSISPTLRWSVVVLGRSSTSNSAHESGSVRSVAKGAGLSNEVTQVENQLRQTTERRRIHGERARAHFRRGEQLTDTRVGGGSRGGAVVAGGEHRARLSPREVDSLAEGVVRAVQSVVSCAVQGRACGVVEE